MKVAAAIGGSLLLLIFGTFGVGSTMLTSVPFASDDQRTLYEQVVGEYRLDIPGSVLLAVDTVRFRQDFGQVDRATVRQTAELFSACADFVPISVEIRGKGQSIPFRVLRAGKVAYGLQNADPGVTVRVVDGQGREYANQADVAAGDYTVVVETPNDHSRYKVRLRLWLDPCGEAEIRDVLDRLGLVGDDRAMVYHLIAMYLPERAYYGHIAPGPYAWPVLEILPITSHFGQRLDPVTGDWALHTGVDIGAPAGHPVRAATEGTVTYAGWDGNYGQVVRISHGDGVTTSYAHLRSIQLTAGQAVVKGQTVGEVGSTGKSTGPHLHFEWRVNGEPVDPLTVYHWTPNENP